MMAPRQKTVDPARIRGEALEVPTGETTYVLEFDDAEIEDLARGLCPEAVARRAWEQSSGYGVANVVGIGASVEMGRSNTGRVVATVADKQGELHT